MIETSITTHRRGQRQRRQRVQRPARGRLERRRLAAALAARDRRPGPDHRRPAGDRRVRPGLQRRPDATSRTWRWPPPRRRPRSWPMTARATSRPSVSRLGHASWAPPRATSTATASPTWPSSARRPWRSCSITARAASPPATATRSPRATRPRAIAVGNFTGHTTARSTSPCCWPRPAPDAYSVAVYTGNGDGTFATPVISAAGNGDSSGTQPDSIVAADFNGDGKTDLAFTTDDGLADVMLADLRRLDELGHQPDAALGPPGRSASPRLTTTTTATPTWSSRSRTPTSRRATGRSSASTCSRATARAASATRRPTRPSASPITTRIGLVAGDFQGSSAGLEVAVPVTRRRRRQSYVDIVPLSTLRHLGQGVIHASCYDRDDSSRRPTSRRHRRRRPQRRRQAEHRADRRRHGQDLRPAGRPRQQPVPAGRDDRRLRRRHATSACWPSRPFMGTAATVATAAPPATRRRSSRTRTAPGPGPIPTAPSSSSTRRARRPPRPTQRQHVQLRLRHQRRGRRRPGHDHRPGRPGDDAGIQRIGIYQHDHRSGLTASRPSRVDATRQPDRDRRSRRRDHAVRLLDPLEPRGHERDRPRRQHGHGPLQQLRPVDQRDALRRHVDDLDRPGAQQRPAGPGRQRLAADRPTRRASPTPTATPPR